MIDELPLETRARTADVGCVGLINCGVLTGRRIRYRCWGSFCCRGVGIWRGLSRRVLLEDTGKVRCIAMGVFGGSFEDYIPCLVAFCACCNA